LIPPVRLLFTSQDHLETYIQEGRQIRLRRNGAFITRRQPMAELAHRDPLASDPQFGDHIDNLIVTVPGATAVRAISRILHRIDHRTTICLVHDGLGVVEALNEALFPRVNSRPNYVLGHMAHVLDYLPSHHHLRYTLNERKHRALFLTVCYRDAGKFPSLNHFPPPESRVPTTHLLRELVTCPDLGGGGYRYDQFLRRKLQDMVFQAAIGPVSTISGLPCRELGGNAAARRLVTDLVGEMSQVIMALPEAQAQAQFLEAVSEGRLEKMCIKKVSHGPVPQSRMSRLVGLGRHSDIDFLNGWFVRRGDELGIPCPANKMVVNMVKTKESENSGRNYQSVPFGRAAAPNSHFRYVAS